MAAKIYMPSSSACKLKHYQFPARLVSLVAVSHAHSMAWCHLNPVVHLGWVRECAAQLRIIHHSLKWILASCVRGILQPHRAFHK